MNNNVRFLLEIETKEQNVPEGAIPSWRKGPGVYLRFHEDKTFEENVRAAFVRLEELLDIQLKNIKDVHKSITQTDRSICPECNSKEWITVRTCKWDKMHDTIQCNCGWGGRR